MFGGVERLDRGSIVIVGLDHRSFICDPNQNLEASQAWCVQYSSCGGDVTVLVQYPYGVAMVLCSDNNDQYAQASVIRGEIINTLNLRISNKGCDKDLVGFSEYKLLPLPARVAQYLD
jgi:hypothetical protein